MVERVIERRQSWASTPSVRRSMQSNRGCDTRPELAVRSELHRRGLRFFVNRRPLPSIRRTADVVFPKLGVAVFVDGCFWHGCPVHHTFAKTNPEFWRNKVERNRARDSETDEALISAGWTVLRVWEHVRATEAADLVEHEVARRRAELGEGMHRSVLSTETGCTDPRSDDLG